MSEQSKTTPHDQPPKKDPSWTHRTGRDAPDVWQSEVTEDDIPRPDQREDAAHRTHLDPVDPPPTKRGKPGI